MNRLIAVVAFSVMSVVGCGTKPPPAPPSIARQNAESVDPWPVAAANLRRNPDLATSRQILNQITAELANNSNFEGVKAMTPDAVREVSQKLQLSKPEIKELGSANFTNLDAAYIAECLVFRDVVRSLDLASLPPERQVRTAFQWVCRHVYLQQATMPRGANSVALPPVPPQFVLSRGHGTGLERAYVFLAMLRQLGLDGCFIGSPNREAVPSVVVENNALTKGPFWGVGARLTDGNVLLFDPWRGEPLPGAVAGSVATLAQVTANSDALKSWFESKENPWDVKPAQVKEATPYVAVPFMALTPRIKTLETKLASEVNVKLAADLTAELAKFGSTAKLWAPSSDKDPFALCSCLGYFLPAEEGGFDTTPPNPEQLYLYVTKVSLIPWNHLQLPRELTSNELVTRMRTGFLVRMTEWIYDGNPREKLARGQLNEVVRIMVEREQRMNALRQQARASNLTPGAIQEWLQKANQLAQELSLAKLPQNQARLPEAEANYQEFWKSNTAQYLYLENTTIVPVAAAEAAHLLAHCKHEQAERAQVRLHRLAATAPERADATKAAQEAWAVAKDAWDRYLVAAEPFLKLNPAKTAHVRQLAARAEKLTTKAAEGW